MLTYSKYSHSNRFRMLCLSGAAACALIMSACGSPKTGPEDKSPDAPAEQSTDRAGVDIGMLKDGSSVQKFISPPGYQQNAKLLTYEGPGWESDNVAYRLYLDGRNVIDIFGKKTPGLILSQTGRGEDYHKMADWGMDILKVGNSLGAGGWGVYQNGQAFQVGNADNYTASVASDTDDKAALKVALKNAGGCASDMTALYTIEAGSRLTKIDVTGDCALPIAAGIVIHKDTQKLASSGNLGWQYIARYGAQSLVPDDLGMAIFYRAEDALATGDDSDDSFVAFKKDAGASYYMGAAWSQEGAASGGGIKDLPAFKSWLSATQKSLNATAN